MDIATDDDYERCVMEYNRWRMLCGIAIEGIVIWHRMCKSRQRMARRPSSRMGSSLMHEILMGHPVRCYETFRLHVDTFNSLCTELRDRYGLRPTRHVSIEESVGIFLFMLAHGCGNRLAQEFFNHSGETIHRHFHRVLDVVLLFSYDIITPNANYNSEVPSYILNNPRYYPFFKDCIGAIDGTHVKASVKAADQPKYIGRKGYATQNIMAACDFNMCFTFVWAGWEGTAHDTRIFYEALRGNVVNFPRPTGDKYYVVDAGYPNTRGYLAPYKGNTIRYHIPDFRRGQTSRERAPSGPKETFNYMHSSLRNVIERTFGVWKSRWPILKDLHVNYAFETQVKIVVASMAIHNFIRLNATFDEAFEAVENGNGIDGYNGDADDDDTIVLLENEGNVSTRQTNEDVRYMNSVRDRIARDLMH